MSDFANNFHEPVRKTDYQGAIQEMFAEIDHLNQQMNDDRKDIDRLRSETELLKIETRAILATLGVAV